MNDKITRLITATGTEIEKMSPMELKRSIFKSEGRVIMGQHLLFAGRGLVSRVTNTELLCAFGADMVMLNTFNLDEPEKNVGMQGFTLKQLKSMCRRPIGIYLGCPKDGIQTESKLYSASGMTATDEHVEKALELGADFIVLGGNPGSGTSIMDVVATTKRVKEKFGDQVLLFAGKWEDGIDEKVLGDPLAQYDSKDVIRQLIDAGADVIDLPAPGSRHGIEVPMIRELVEYVHSYKPGTLAMCFLNSSVEGADPDTIRLVSLMMKQTGADIHAIGDGGFGGCACPENIMQMSITMKGKSYTYYRMAGVNR